MTAPDPLAHVPDPSDRYQVFGYLDADGAPWIEVADAETREGLRLPLLDALKVSGGIALQAGHLIEQAMQRAEYEDGLASESDRVDAWLRGLGRKPGESR